MTFTNIQTEILDRLDLTSSADSTRIARAINRHYRTITSSIGMQTSRRTSVTQAVTFGVQTVTFTSTEKIISIQYRGVTPSRTLKEITMEEMYEVTAPTSDNITRYAIKTQTSDTVTIMIDCLPQTEFTLYADVHATLTDLSGSNEPAFPESYHDILIYAVLIDEYDKVEKPQLSVKAEKKYDQRISELKMWFAAKNSLDIYQGKTKTSSTFSGSGGSSSASTGATSYTQTGLITFDRDPSAPFAVTASSAVVTNLDADKLDGQEGAYYRDATNLNAGTVPDARFPATLPAASGANLTALNATQLTTGTVPDARFPATLPAASGVNLTALNATQLTSGTVPDARFPATLPAASGINLTALNATNIASGSLADARLSSNVPLKDAANVFTSAENTFAAGASTETLKVAGVINTDSTQAGTAADTADTTLFSYSLPANALNANGRALRITAWGSFGANANNKTVRLKWNGTAGTSAPAVTTSANGLNWMFQAIVIRTASGAQDVVGWGQISDSIMPATINTTAAATDSGAIVIAVTAQNGTAAANDIVYSGSIIELLN